MSEISACCIVFDYFALETNDATAYGILRITRDKRFIICLHLLEPAVKKLKKLCLIFQSGDLNCSQITSELYECVEGIKELQDGAEVCKSLRSSWYKYQSDLGEFTDSDAQMAKQLVSEYCLKLIDNLHDRFPQPELITAFKIFDPNQVPSDSIILKKYGEEYIRKIYTVFGHLLPNDDDVVVTDYHSFKERLIRDEFDSCETTSHVCCLLCRDPIYTLKLNGQI